MDNLTNCFSCEYLKSIDFVDDTDMLLETKHICYLEQTEISNPNTPPDWCLLKQAWPRTYK